MPQREKYKRLASMQRDFRLSIVWSGAVYQRRRCGEFFFYKENKKPKNKTFVLPFGMLAIVLGRRLSFVICHGTHR